MEKEIGVKLIQRDKVNPKLTPAGQNVLRHCERILNEYNELMQDAKRFSAERKKLTVGILEDGIRAGNTGRIIRQFAEENPDVEIDFRNTSESAAFDQIQEGELDCGILVHFPEVYREQLNGTVISWDHDCVFMNRNNPLASKEKVSVKDLRSEGFIVVDASQSRFGFNRTMGLCLQYGFAPHIAKSVSSVTTALLEVDMNYGVMILHNSMQDIAGPETVAIPLEGEPELPVQMIHRKDSGNPALERFREFIRARVPQGEPEA